MVVFESVGDEVGPEAAGGVEGAAGVVDAFLFFKSTLRRKLPVRIGKGWSEIWKLIDEHTSQLSDEQSKPNPHRGNERTLMLLRCEHEDGEDEHRG